MKDLVINRKEYQDFQDNIQWNHEGKLYLNTLPNLSIGQPIYQKEIGNDVIDTRINYNGEIDNLVVLEKPAIENGNENGDSGSGSSSGSSKRLFHIEEKIFELDNKWDFENEFDDNTLLNSQPNSFIRMIKLSRDGKLGLMSNNCDIYILKNEEQGLNDKNQFKNAICIDEKGKSARERAYNCFVWSDDGKELLVGNENGDVLVFQIDDGLNVTNATTIKIVDCNTVDNSWIRHIIAKGVGESRELIVSLINNSVYYVRKDPTSESSIVIKIKENDRFEINQVYMFPFVPDDNKRYVLLSITGKVELIIFNTHEVHHHEIKQLMNNNQDIYLEKFYIIPFEHYTDKREVILLSNETSFTLTIDSQENIAQRMNFIDDNIVGKQLNKKFKKWNGLKNEFNKYDTKVNINGITLSNDGYCLSIGYTMERISIKYRIVSEYQYRIMFLPLYKEWEIDSVNNTKGFGWYQTYQIYNRQLPKINPTIQEVQISQESNSNDDIKTTFIHYLRSLLKDEYFNNQRFQNFLRNSNTSTKGMESITILRGKIYDFIRTHTNALEMMNDADRACYSSICNVLGVDIITTTDMENNPNFVVEGDFIKETFDFQSQDNNDPDHVQSQQGHQWGRCCVTLLPVMTTKTGVCPVTSLRTLLTPPHVTRSTHVTHQISDSNSDSESPWPAGWLVAGLLHVFHQESAATGAHNKLA
ncbi:hypothetical protein TBLA_0G02710 [Henningerozyma blattae CBS 6284]|uniref:Transcription factor IIIC putative zinc-finger domain-containing protein n=1 Tax=Henningerozyma blattae (strain ATCC 34711 / CBS 6284 / DSM 70876 / NBRC 10599 / NRRL Y-10934 / UCD 77-7) TaxID=1071380 RepID=I2H757_HENB6|nr:hypothetical protein TBLA_0G02710 [Tetrapisispora blattae CBS 6284]CCH62209.1 hypothetical protein TBLA_0G02710 [Tetrapisispora blattae CBS 6284]